MPNLADADVSHAIDIADARALRRAYGKFATGVTVVTANVGGKKIGMTANSFSSLSIDPPLILWSLRKSSSNYQDFRSAAHFAVSVLAKAQLEVSQRFAKSGPDKFVGFAHGVGAGEAPTIVGAAAVFECETTDFHEGGDHVIMVGRVVKAAMAEVAPLAFAEGRYLSLAEFPELLREEAARPVSNAGIDDPMRQFASVLLLRAYNRMADELADMREREGLGTNEIRLLNVAATHQGKALAALMPLLYLSDLAAEDALQRLVSLGFVDSDADRRVIVTEAGRKKSRQTMAGMAEVDSRFLARLPTSQRKPLRDALEAIIDAKF